MSKEKNQDVWCRLMSVKLGMDLRLMELAEEVSRREKCRLYDLEFVTGHRGKGRILRVYIERDDVGTHASIDDCANVSRGLSLILDVEDVIEGGRYELEVSTPGLERKLRLPWHFERAKGKTIQIKSKNPFVSAEVPATASAGPTALKGELLEVSDTDLVVKSEGKLWRGSLADVDRARIVFEEVKKNNLKHRRGR